MNGKMIEAKKLREYAELTIESKPGIYKWWAEKAELKIIIDMLCVPLKDIESGIEQNNGLYCIYVGQANSLEDRLKGNHVNGRNKSTLRKSIGAVLLKKYEPKDIEKKINEFVDKLNVKYKLVSQDKLDDAEKNEIGPQYLRVFNSKHNKHSLRTKYGITGKLTDLRKEFEKNNINSL